MWVAHADRISPSFWRGHMEIDQTPRTVEPPVGCEVQGLHQQAVCSQARYITGGRLRTARSATRTEIS